MMKVLILILFITTSESLNNCGYEVKKNKYEE